MHPKTHDACPAKSTRNRQVRINALAPLTGPSGTLASIHGALFTERSVEPSLIGATTLTPKTRTITSTTPPTVAGTRTEKETKKKKNSISHVSHCPSQCPPSLHNIPRVPDESSPLTRSLGDPPHPGPFPRTFPWCYCCRKTDRQDDITHSLTTQPRARVMDTAQLLLLGVSRPARPLHNKLNPTSTGAPPSAQGAGLHDGAMACTVPPQDEKRLFISSPSGSAGGHSKGRGTTHHPRDEIGDAP